MRNIVLVTLLSIAVAGCKQPASSIPYPSFATVAAEIIEVEGSADPIYRGGYGSSMVYHPADSCFYLLTDRGPNVDGTTPESKVFPITDYAPTIGRFRLQGDSLILLEKIVLKDSLGQRLTGLPNSEGDGVTGEVAYNLSGDVIKNPSRGIDSEGLAIAPDGTFWVSDEYAPFIMQFSRSGKLLQELSPSRGLPDYYAKRRPNRGMEGLTISKDGRKLFGIMQSPLYLPSKVTKDVSVNNRIIEIDLQNGNTREFIYTMESPLNMISEICLVNDSSMLVLERDGEFPQAGKGFKRVYQIDIKKAIDISGKEIEMLSAQQLSQQGIIPASKRLLVDLMAAIPSYRHDKPEGISLIGDSILCVVNDDDFGINATADGKYTPKLDVKGELDRNTVYFIAVNLK